MAGKLSKVGISKSSCGGRVSALNQACSVPDTPVGGSGQAALLAKHVVKDRGTGAFRDGKKAGLN